MFASVAKTSNTATFGNALSDIRVYLLEVTYCEQCRSILVGLDFKGFERRYRIVGKSSVIVPFITAQREEVAP